MGWEEQWDEAVTQGMAKLNLSCLKLDDDAAADLAKRLAVDRTLTEIKIDEPLAALTTLILENNQIGDVGASKIGQALTSNTTLTTLSLECNQVGDVGASKIGESLATNTTLTELYLQRNQIGNVGASNIGQALTSNTMLTTLFLSRNQIGEVGASKIGESLATNTTLTKLDLGDNPIGNVGASKIGESLATNTKLTILFLGFNEIGDVGASKIGEALATNTTLTILYLDDNEIGDVGACKIGASLGTNTSLRWLFLRRNQIGDVGASTIGESLANNTTLEWLLLRGNRIGDGGLHKIGESLARNTTLTTVDIDGNQFTVHSLRAFAQSQLNRTSVVYFGADTTRLFKPIFHQLKRDRGVWNRIKDDLVAAKTCKVILCGRWGAGKTTLRQSLEALGNSLAGGRTIRRHSASNTVQASEGRTLGMEVVRVKCSDGSGNAMMVHDIGGQDEFHVQHDRIMGDESAIFVILCNLAAETVIDGKAVKYDAFDELAHLKYWLGYILMHNETLQKPRVLMVGTRGLGRQSQASNLMEHCAAAYNDTLNLHPTMYCIDASLPRDDQTMALWKGLQAEVRNKLADAKIPRLSAKIVENQRNWCKIHGSILRWGQFVTCIEELFDPVYEEYLMDVCEFLHRHGHVLYYREHPQLNQFIVLNPTAFSQTIGALIAPSSLSTDRPGFDAGVCSLKEICKMFPAMMEAEVTTMLDYFELAYKLQNETLLFPVHLPPRSPTLKIVRADPRLDMLSPPILLCRRFISRSAAGRMTHGTFPRFQVRLHREFREKLQLKQHYAYVADVTAQVFAMLICHDLEGFVDLAVWGQPDEVHKLTEKLRELLYEDHMLLLRMQEQAISARMTFDGVAWPLPIAISLTELDSMKPSAFVDWYTQMPNNLRDTLQPNHLCEPVAALLHGYPAWGTGQHGITLDEFYEEFVKFRVDHREAEHIPE